MGNFIVKILKFQYNYIVKKKKKADRHPSIRKVGLLQHDPKVKSNEKRSDFIQCVVKPLALAMGI